MLCLSQGLVFRDEALWDSTLHGNVKMIVGVGAQKSDLSSVFLAVLSFHGKLLNSGAHLLPCLFTPAGC